MKESSFYQEIMDEGRIEAQRTAIQEALSVHFGAEAASEFTDGLGRLTDRAQLSELHRVAVGSRRIGEFRQALKALTAPVKVRRDSPKTGR